MQAREPQAALSLPSSLCSLDLLLGFHCESSEVSKGTLPGVLGAPIAELFGDTSDTATAQLEQTSPRTEGTCRRGLCFTQEMPVKS